METIQYLEEIFPLDSVAKIVSFIKQLASCEKFVIAIPSLVLGWFENELTLIGKDRVLPGEEIFPSLNWNTFVKLYLEYKDIVSLCSSSDTQIEKFEEKSVIKQVANFVWSYLSNLYFKDKLHIQSVYSFLKGMSLILCMKNLNMLFCSKAISFLSCTGKRLCIILYKGG